MASNGGTPSKVTGGSAVDTGGAGGAGGSKGSDPLLSQAPEGTVEITTVGTCGGTTCKEGEVCCLQTGHCFHADKPEECTLNSGGASDQVLQLSSQEQTPLCSSNADCKDDEYCNNHETCLGVGYCASRTNCPTSSGNEVCGCNGVTYPNDQSACFAGVRVVGSAACGEPHDIGSAGGFAPFIVTFCGSDEECGTGLSCCAITGECYDSNYGELCSYPSGGTSRACIDDTQCFAEDEFCSGPGCVGKGGCVSTTSEECDGYLDPVCGCDGRTYTNDGCAVRGGVRVLHKGACADAGVAVDG